jgi:hypothetical protein
MTQQDKNAQPAPASEPQINNTEVYEVPPIEAAAVSTAPEKSRWRAFWDFFVLFSGISTKSNLSRTRKEPIQSRGVFLFRSRKR